LATAVDRQPFKIKIKAAIRIPAQSPGIEEACWRSFSSVTCGLVIFNGFMAHYHRAFANIYLWPLD
jgi:hypothetical protein